MQCSAGGQTQTVEADAPGEQPCDRLLLRFCRRVGFRRFRRVQIVVCVAAPIPRAEHNFAGFANSNFERQRNARRLPRCNIADKRVWLVVLYFSVKVDNILITGKIIILVNQIGCVFFDTDFVRVRFCISSLLPSSLPGRACFIVPAIRR